MHIRDSAAVIAAKIRRSVRTRRNPLGALIYEPLLDGPPVMIEPPLVGRWSKGETRDLHCGFCRQTAPHQKIKRGVEEGVVYCTSCGSGRDNYGTLSRRVNDYGRGVG